MSGSLTKIQKKLIELFRDLGEVKGLIKYQCHKQKLKITSLENDLIIKSFEVKNLDSFVHELVKRLFQEREIFEKEMELNLRYSI